MTNVYCTLTLYSLLDREEIKVNLFVIVVARWPVKSSSRATSTLIKLNESSDRRYILQPYSI